MLEIKRKLLICYWQKVVFEVACFPAVPILFQTSKETSMLPNIVLDKMRSQTQSVALSWGFCDIRKGLDRVVFFKQIPFLCVMFALGLIP